MKKYLLTFVIIIVSSISALFVSCNSDDDNEASQNSAPEENYELLKFAEEHNAGLNFIKQNAENEAYVLTSDQLDHLYSEWLISKYGREQTSEIIQHVSSLSETALCGNIPDLSDTRARTRSIGRDSNFIALDALDDCMNSIGIELKNYSENEIFDNIVLLEKLHEIIIEKYLDFSEKCSTDIEKESVSQTLGVLYGSIEYWTNADNVDAWLSMQLISDNNLTSNSVSVTNKRKEKSKEDKKENDRKLSKSEWVQVVCTADAAGAAIGGGAAGLAASAAAALYFDVE